MKTFRFTLAATAASMMLVAGIAGACDKASATTASNTKSCCAKKAGGTTTATGEHAGCAKTAGTKACCAKGQTTTAQVGDMANVKTCTFRPGSVAFKGTVICNHCDLHKTETCQTMFRTDGGCVFTLAGDNVKDLKDEAGGGKKLVRIKGSVSENGELTVSTYRVVRSLEGASAL